MTIAEQRQRFRHLAQAFGRAWAEEKSKAFVERFAKALVKAFAEGRAETFPKTTATREAKEVSWSNVLVDILPFFLRILLAVAAGIAVSLLMLSLFEIIWAARHSNPGGIYFVLFICGLVGGVIVSIPAIDLARRVKAKQKLIPLLVDFGEDEWQFLRSIVRDPALVPFGASDPSELKPTKWIDSKLRVANLMHGLSSDDDWGKLVLDALFQRSQTGRMRYLDNVKTKAVTLRSIRHPKRGPSDGAGRRRSTPPKGQ